MPSKIVEAAGTFQIILRKQGDDILEDENIYDK